MLIHDAIPSPTFANHETFHLRYRWLKKAYDHVLKDSLVFQRDDAPVILGVGKNMVRAIKFWGIAHKIIESQGSAKNTGMVPTDMGRMIFENNGLDPYLEKLATPWLLHWLLFASPCRVPVWWIIMNEFAVTNIKIEEMSESIKTRITNIPQWHTPSPKSIKKDIDVFIHTYTTRQDKLLMDDYIDCPFRQLSMIKQNSRDMMRFVFGKKYGISPLITAFVCFDFIHRSDTKSRNMSISRLATEAGSIGNIFKIGENDLADMLSEAARASSLFKLENLNGAQHLTFTGIAKDISIRMLELAYGKEIKIPKKKMGVLTS